MARFSRKESIGLVSVTLNIDTGLSLWSSIKLRLAGRAYEPIAQRIGDVLVDHLREQLDAARGKQGVGVVA